MPVIQRRDGEGYARNEGAGGAESAIGGAVPFCRRGGAVCSARLSPAVPRSDSRLYKKSIRAEEYFLACSKITPSFPTLASAVYGGGTCTYEIKIGGRPKGA